MGKGCLRLFIVLILGIGCTYCTSCKWKGSDFMVIRHNYFDTVNFRLPLKDSFKPNIRYWRDIPKLISLRKDTRFMLIELHASFGGPLEGVLYDFSSRQYFMWPSKNKEVSIDAIKDTMSDLLKAYRPVMHSSEEDLRKAAAYRPSGILLDGVSYVINDVKVVDNRLLNNAYHVVSLHLEDD